MQSDRKQLSPIYPTAAASGVKLAARIHPEILFVIITATTLIASYLTALSGYIFGLWIIAPNLIQLTDAGIISISISFTYTLLFFSFGKYSTLLEDHPATVRRSILAWIVGFMVLIWTVFLMKESATYSRFAMICCFLFGMAILPIIHMVLGKFVSKMMKEGKIWFHHIVLIGLTDAEEMRKIEIDLARRGIFVAHKSLISLAPIDRSQFLSRCREVTTEIQSTLQEIRLDGIWIVAPLNEQRRFDELWAALTQVPLPVVLFPNRPTQRILHLNKLKVGRYYGYEVQRAPLTRSERAIKRAMDITIASMALIVLSPIFIFTAIAILLETGRPILFKQDRKGFGGRPFKILKFRSMRVQENGPEIKQAQSSDPRITPIGRVLRRTSIDELPQLINVLRGEMSIVGPRPHAIAHDNFYDRIITTYAFRHHVKPGITGWAQVNGFRGNTSKLALMEGRVEHDIWYINHWSPWLDLRIMIKTALEVLWHEEAY